MSILRWLSRRERDKVDHELDDEIRAHIQERAEDLRHAGVAGEEAERQGIRRHVTCGLAV